MRPDFEWFVFPCSLFLCALLQFLSPPHLKDPLQVAIFFLLTFFIGASPLVEFPPPPINLFLGFFSPPFNFRNQNFGSPPPFFLLLPFGTCYISSFLGRADLRRGFCVFKEQPLYSLVFCFPSPFPFGWVLFPPLDFLGNGRRVDPQMLRFRPSPPLMIKGRNAAFPFPPPFCPNYFPCAGRQQI